MSDDADLNFAPPPTFSDEEKERCRSSGRPMPIIWEAYKYVTITAIKVAHIRPDSPACRSHEPVHSAVTFGLANRCARLMGATMDLTVNARNREAFSILARPIVESALKLIWICQQDHDARIRRYLADGLRADLEFERVIIGNIGERGGTPKNVEIRMTRVIRRALDASGLTVAEVEGEPKMPDMFSIMQQIGLDRRFYVAVQRIGSQAVHGTWPDLLMNYVKYEGENRFFPKSDPNVPKASQYVGLSYTVLTALSVYARFLIEETSLAGDLSGAMIDTRDWFMDLYDELCPSDYQEAPLPQE